MCKLSSCSEKHIRVSPSFMIALVLTDGGYSNIYLGIVWVFSSISGLITFLPDGRIQSINENFSRLLFGYNSDELIGQVICFHLICFSDCL
jgi:hypothetical protein